MTTRTTSQKLNKTTLRRLIKEEFKAAMTAMKPGGKKQLVEGSRGVAVDSLIQALVSAWYEQMVNSFDNSEMGANEEEWIAQIESATDDLEDRLTALLDTITVELHQGMHY